MAIPILNLIVGGSLMLGGIQEALVRGIMHGEWPSLVVGTTGTAVNLVLACSGVALWGRWQRARDLALLGAAAALVFHLLAAVPPPHYVGAPGFLVGFGYPAVLLSVLWRRAQVAR